MSASTNSGAGGAHLPSGNELHMLVNDHLQQTFRKAGQLGTLPLGRCKVLIVGDGGVGKTSLRKHLMGERVPRDQPSTVGIETFEVESFDVGMDWKKRAQNCDDLDRSAAWWLVSHFKEELHRINYVRFAPRTGLLYFLAVYALQLLLVTIPLREGFVYGFFIYYIFFLAMVMLLFQDFFASYGVVSDIMIYVVLADAVMHKQVGDYEEWPRSMAGIANFCFFLVMSLALSFSMSCFGKSGFLFSLSMMNAPCEVEFFSDFFTLRALTGSTLQFDSVRCLNVMSSHIGTILGLSATALIKYKIQHLKIQYLAGVALQVASLVILFVCSCWYPIKPLQLFALGIPLGGTMLLGLESGREVFLHFGIGVAKKATCSALAGLVFGYMIRWRLEISWKIIFGLPFLLANCYTWLKLHGRPGSGRNYFPIGEFLRAYKASKLGSNELPIVFTLMDFAGQSDYYEMHHAFMIDMAVYCLVFDLRQGVADLESQYKRILFWLTKIRLHAARDRNPSVILVGTHRQSLDKCGEDVEEFSVHITKKIQSSRTYSDWLLFNKRGTVLFTVENLVSARSDAGLVELKAAIQSTARDICGQEEHHLSWLQVVRVCQTLASQGHKLIQVTHLWKKVQEDSSLGGILDELHLRRCLVLASQAGYILYKDVSHLRSFVVLDQSFLMDTMKRFLEPNPPWALKLGAHWDMLQMEGISSMRLIAHIIEETAREHGMCCLPGIKSWLTKLTGCQNKDRFAVLEAIVNYLKEIDFLHELDQSDHTSHFENSKPKRKDRCSHPTTFISDKSPYSLNKTSSSNLDVCNASAEKLQETCNNNHFVNPNNVSDGQRLFLIPSKLSQCSEIGCEENPAVELYIDCEDAPVTDVYPRLIACALNKNTDIHQRTRHKPKLFRNVAMMQDPDFGVAQIETLSDIPEQQLLRLRLWPIREGAVVQALSHLLQHFDTTVERYFPSLKYTVGVLCINSDCDEMRTKSYKHILPIADLLPLSKGNCRSSQPEGKTLVMCGTKHYQVELTHWTVQVQRVKPAAGAAPCLPTLAQRCCSYDGPLDAVAQVVADFLVRHALREWKTICRALGILESDIEAIEYAHPRSLKQQCRQGLWVWWRQCDVTDDVSKVQIVIQALREYQLALPADALEDHFSGDQFSQSMKASPKNKTD